MLSHMIQMLVAAALAASSLLIQPSASAAVAAPSVDATPVAATLHRASGSQGTGSISHSWACPTLRASGGPASTVSSLSR